MTLSDHKEKQIIRDTVQKCFLRDFLTMFFEDEQKVKVVIVLLRIEDEQR
jgi:hypothetical protein